MSINKFNIEGYDDPTAYEALTHINAEERKGRFRPMVYICSPFSGDPEGNTEKAKRYCRYATQAGYLPFAPHLFFPLFLRDELPRERALGLSMAIVMLTKCSELWVFGDDMTGGMAKEIRKARARNMRIRHFTTDCKEIINGRIIQ